MATFDSGTACPVCHCCVALNVMVTSLMRDVLLDGYNMIEVPDKIVKELLEIIDEVGWYLDKRGWDDSDASDLLVRLKDAKHNFENTAKSKDGGERKLRTPVRVAKGCRLA